MANKEKLEATLEELSTLYNDIYLPFIRQYGPVDLGKLRGSKNMVVKTYNPTYTNIRILGDLLNRKLQIGNEGCYCTAKGIDWIMSTESNINNDYTDSLDEHAISQIVKICDGIKDSKLNVCFLTNGLNIYVPIATSKLYKLLESIDKIKTINENLIVREISFTFLYNGVKISITGK